MRSVAASGPSFIRLMAVADWVRVLACRNLGSARPRKARCLFSGVDPPRPPADPRQNLPRALP